MQGQEFDVFSHLPSCMWRFSPEVESMVFDSLLHNHRYNYVHEFMVHRKKSCNAILPYRNNTTAYGGLKGTTGVLF